MNWPTLLSMKRYRGSEGVKADTASASEFRSPFTKDADRIVFSPYFRRLNDKTQVQLGPRIDSVRTRLTHSLETSSVGRSLGKAVGSRVIKKYELNRQLGFECLEAGDFGSIVAAGCLAHDIGNTPFGHTGEEAIQHWFCEEADHDLLAPLTPGEQADLEGFEGNAQGFRILTRLEGWRSEGGLRLTVATLGAFLKYPIPSTENGGRDKAKNKKFSYFQDDIDAFEKVADELGLKKNERSAHRCRHPLAYLVEAADDISYLIADLEDGVESQSLESTEVEGLLGEIVPTTDRQSLSRISAARDRVAYLRAKAIGALIEEVVDVFMKNEESILEGTHPAKGLLSQVRSADRVDRIKSLSHDKLYNESTTVAREIAGYEVVHGLLEMYVSALFEKEKAMCHNRRAATKYEKIYKLLGQPDVSKPTSRYKWLLNVTDRISAMTDTTAMSEYRRLHGIM